MLAEIDFFRLSICDEPPTDQEKITQLNDTLHQLLQRWATNLSQLREEAVAIIQLTSSLPSTSEELNAKISEILLIFQTGSIIHCGSSFDLPLSLH